MPAIELAEAWRRLQDHLRTSRPREADWVEGAEAVGRVLAQDQRAPHDHPPTDQSLRDGIAYAAPALERAAASKCESPIERQTTHVTGASAAEVHSIVGTIYPGEIAPRPLWPGQAVRVMTGAPLPPGTVAVAMIEDVQFVMTGRAPDGTNIGTATPATPWQTALQATEVIVPPAAAGLPRYVLAQGQVYRHGEVLVTAGTRLRPIHVGLLASAGHARLPCFRPPRVAVLTTGDELCPPGTPLPAGQIYNSNGPLLLAALRQAGIQDCRAQHLGDSQAEIRAFLAQQLGQVDLLITTGAVSAGQKDQLPQHFTDLGVQSLFHGVHIKPGKPVYCGHWSKPPTSDEGPSSRATYVLGLPGNPISVWTTFQLFARPILAALLGTSTPPRWLHARLAQGGHFNDARLTFWPGRLETNAPPWQITALKETAANEATNAIASKETLEQDAGLPNVGTWLPSVTPLPWQGSPDLKTPTMANVLIYFPPQTSGPAPTAGTPVPVLWLEE